MLLWWVCSPQNLAASNFTFSTLSNYVRCLLWVSYQGDFVAGSQNCALTVLMPEVCYADKALFFASVAPRAAMKAGDNGSIRTYSRTRDWKSFIGVRQMIAFVTVGADDMVSRPPSLPMHQFQAKPCRCSRWVASIIEHIDLGCASNLMRVLISLTAASRRV